MIWITIAAALIAALSWVTVWFPGWPWWIAGVVTGTLALAIAGIFAFRKIRAARRAAALERELLKQAEDHAGHLRPERRIQVLELQTRMKQAILELRKSKLGGRKSGNAALYALPWYAIVGPPAAGKTTALTQSGLAFVSPGGGSPRLQGTAGTQNCDWWFSREAILLDTAGRFVTHDDDEEEWFAFLDTLKKFREERPLDGVIVAVSLADLLDEHASSVEALAQKLRTKIEELLARLDMVLPMYVVFTKADLIGGFVEFWEDLTKQERGQVWGATFALDDERLSEPTSAFEEEFGHLVTSVHAKMLARLPEERITGSRTRVLQFPAEFRALRAPLGRFIGELCQSSPYRDTTIFRGFYFTSGTQVGRPFDRVLASMLSGFGLGDRVGGEAREMPAPGSYFVTDLFRTVIFPDRNLAIRSGRWAATLAHRQILLAAAALVAALLVVVPSLVSYAENRDLVATTTQTLAIAPAEDAKIAGGAARLDALLDRVQELEKKKGMFSARGWWGPYAAAALYEPVHRLYVNRLRSIIEGPLRQQVVGDVHAIDGVVRLDDPENFWGAYADVKLFVLMTSPELFDPKSSGKADLPDWAAQHLADKWARTSGVGSAPELERLRLHCRYYVDALIRDRTWAWPTDDATLEGARRRLVQQSLEALQYSWLLHSTRSAQPIRPDQIFIGAAATYVSSRAPSGVPGAYTREGWNAVKANLTAESSQFALEPWVLGTGGTQPASTARLREMYFDKYVRAWRDLLTNLVVSTPTSIEDAIAELRALDSVENGPYTGLFRTLATNARLDMAPTGLADKMKGAATAAIGRLLKADAGATEQPISLVEDRLSPLIRFGAGEPARAGSPSPPSSLVQCLDELRTLEVKLGQLRESKTEPTGELEADLARTSGTVERLLAGLDGSTRLLVEPLLMNPIRGSRAGVASSSHGALEDKWKADVWTTYDSKVSGRYPFGDGPDIALADFMEFFRPQTGTLWGFFDKNLQDGLAQSGAAFAPRPSADPVGFTGDFLRCLGHAQQITDAIFGAGQDAAVPMSIKLESSGPNVAEVSFTVDGQSMVYRNEPERWFPAEWPGKGPNHGALLKVKGANFTDEIPRNGDFGFFRLLASGGLKAQKQQSTPLFVASFPLSRAGEPPVTVSVRPTRSVHPFSPDFFSRLKCPELIVAGSSATP